MKQLGRLLCVATFAVTCVALISTAPAERPVPNRSNLKSGLRNTLYDDDKLGHEVKERFDQSIDFTFGGGSPDPVIKGKKYSCRWFAWLDVPETTDYLLAFKVNGSVKLWIDEKPVIDFASGNKTKDTGRKETLTQGLHFLHVDYSNSAGDGSIIFQWQKGKEKRQTVPSSVFFREKGPNE